MMSARRKTVGLLILAFFVPVFLYLAIMAAARVTPFGSHTLLLWDANYQNTAFLSYWQRVLRGQADMWYSFSRTLGNNMIGLIAFYLASPLNLLLLLPVPFPLLYSMLVLLKIGLCGLTFMLFLRIRDWKNLIFSTTYALSGFMAVYFFRVAWLDGMILVPLVALGIRHIHEGKKPILYTLSLGAALLSQYYFGYMLCLFSVLYFLINLSKWRLKTIGVFALGSGLAAGLAAVILIPVYLTIAQGYGLPGSGILSLHTVNTLSTLVSKLYTASISTVQMGGNAPNLYVGIPVLVLALLFLLNGKIPLGKRLRSLVLAGILFLSFWLAAPYYLWHAFDAPNYYPARFSFLFSFVLIEMGYEGLRECRNPQKRLLVIAGLFAALSFVLFRQLTVEYLAYKTIFFDVAVCAAVCGLLLIRKWRTAVILAICALQFAGLFLNGYYAYRRLSQLYTAENSAYLAETEETQALVDRVKAQDDTLYRIEKNFSRNDNDPLLYDYRGISHMSSDLNQAFLSFCTQIGLHQGNYHLSYRAGTTPVLESLLGVKYILRKDGVAFAPPSDGYDLLWRDGGVAAFMNTDAMPVAYLVPMQESVLSNGEPFANQNVLLSDFIGEPAAVFTPMDNFTRDFDGTWSTYTFTAEANRPLYMKSYGTDYTLDGTPVDAARLNGTVRLPVQDTDVAYTVSLTAPLQFYLAYFDEGAFLEAMEKLKPYGAYVQSDRESHLLIDAAADSVHSQLLLTLPYDEGWRVWVDGERAEATARYGALLAVNLTPGVHTVELRFTPRGLWAGAAISGITLLAVVCIGLGRRRKQTGRDEA